MASSTSNPRTLQTRVTFGRQGFALINFISLVPVALILLTGLTLFSVSLKNKNLASASCRQAVFKAQSEMGRILRQLLKLNPEIRYWRIERRMIEIQIRAAQLALQPKLVAALMVKKAVIVAQQIRLRQVQQALLWQAKFERVQTQQRFVARTHELRPHDVRSKSRVPDLAVRFQPQFGLGAEAFVRPDFKSAQTLSLQWRVRLLHQVPASWLQTLRLNPLTLAGSCAATLNPEGKTWKAQLSAVKY